MILKKEGKWGLVDIKNSSVKIPFEYDSLRVMDMSNYLAYLENDKWGVINEHGEKMMEAKYDGIDMMGDQLYSNLEYDYKTCFYYNDGHGGIINEELKETIKFIDIRPSGSLYREEDLYWVSKKGVDNWGIINGCLLYTSPSPRDRTRSRMPSSA